MIKYKRISTIVIQDAMEKDSVAPTDSDETDNELEPQKKKHKKRRLASLGDPYG